MSNIMESSSIFTVEFIPRGLILYVAVALLLTGAGALSSNDAAPPGLLLVHTILDDENCSVANWSRIESIARSNMTKDNGPADQWIKGNGVNCCCKNGNTKEHNNMYARKARQCILFQMSSIPNNITNWLIAVNRTLSTSVGDGSYIIGGYASVYERTSAEYNSFVGFLVPDPKTVTDSKCSSCLDKSTPDSTVKSGIGTPTAEPQTADKPQTSAVAGGVGGSLAGLALLSTLAAMLYRKLKKNKVDDDGSSFNDVAPIVSPGGIDFPEAPNSVAPAGTG